MGNLHITPIRHQFSDSDSSTQDPYDSLDDVDSSPPPPPPRKNRRAPHPPLKHTYKTSKE